MLVQEVLSASGMMGVLWASLFCTYGLLINQIFYYNKNIGSD